MTDIYADRGRIGKRKSAQPPVQYGKTCVAGVSQRRCLAAELTPDVSIVTTLASLDLSESGTDWKTERCSSSGGFRKGLWSKRISNATPGCGVDPRFVPYLTIPSRAAWTPPRTCVHTRLSGASEERPPERQAPSASSSLFYCCRRVDRRVLIGVQAARDVVRRQGAGCCVATARPLMARGFFFRKSKKITRFPQWVLTFTHPHWGKGGSSSHTARGSPYLHIPNRARVHFSGRERASP